MRKVISYRDAVKLLGGDGPIAKALEAVFLGTVGVATAGGSDLALGLIDAKLEIIRLSRELLGTARDQLNGLGRHSRTQRLEAAHSVIVIVAFFEALEELDLPFAVEDLELARHEVISISEMSDRRGAMTNAVLRSEVYVPEVHRTFESTCNVLEQKVYSQITKALINFVDGLAIWERLDRTRQDRAMRAMTDLPRAATMHYRELYRRLALDFPEFALWVDLGQQEATRVLVKRGLADLEGKLLALLPGRAAAHQVESIVRANQAPLDEPIYEGADLPDGLRLPRLAAAYVDPLCRVAVPATASDLSAESWWKNARLWADLPAFLASHLTSPQATYAPLVVLGQPGAGKSVLTKILAARLPAGQFLPIRVPLRHVPADASVQEQIEHAIHARTHERVYWADLARSASDDGVLPVVLLDGLDELLQATGTHRADYLYQVARFQREELAQNRALAVVITTRTAVADRCRLPEGVLALRLEPFSGEQIGRWLDEWNAVNETYFARRGLRPMTTESAIAQHELAVQPLLLFMLALYDADANALQKDGGILARAELYQRLLTRFASREVAKRWSSHSNRAFGEAVDQELLRLAIVAFAMLNRGRQWVTAEELDRDLAALFLERSRMDTGFAASLTHAEEVIGRFFFVHQAQAEQDNKVLKTYEFLHATFGEYLVAFLLHRVLEQLRTQAGTAAGPLGGGRLQDGLLYALTSFTVLSARRPVLDFVRELTSGKDGYRELLLRLFRGRDHRTDENHERYEPQTQTPVRRDAYYGVNLVLLCAAVSESVAGRELFGLENGSDPLPDWRALALLWKSSLLIEEWRDLTRNLVVKRSQGYRHRDMTLYLAGPETWITNASEPLAPPAIEEVSTVNLGVEANFLCMVALDILMHGAQGLEPAVFIEADSSVMSLVSGLWTGRNVDAYSYDLAGKATAHLPDKSRHLSRTLQLLRTDIVRMPPDSATLLLSSLRRLTSQPDEDDLFICCMLEVVARHPETVSYLSSLLLAGASVSKVRWTVGLLELGLGDFHPLSQPTVEHLLMIKRTDPLLFRRAQRVIRMEGDRYGLRWPEGIGSDSDLPPDMRPCG
ncbi:NACHT domain-containing protein [Microbispora sp. H10885]|uniref:NACHT domain-containing protein n=1 Tax=Microbispora sp. H10885 TaxID=2729110 RepID=UPI001604143F|nr:hypothetical protein [Microbispora sp. H10885]